MENTRSRRLPRHLRAANGIMVPIQEVLAAMLKFMKKKVLEHAGRILGEPVEASKFRWVATVPAIWGIQAKNVMRDVSVKPCMIL